MLKIKHFEDFQVGRKTTVGEYVITKQEIVEFAEKWDPQPFHVDEEAAKKSGFKGLITCGCHLVAIAIKMLDSKETKTNVLAGLGWDELRFPNPARPDDRLTLTVECLTKRESQSRPDRGVVRTLITVANQKGEPVLTFKDNILVAKRSGSTE